MKTMQPLIVTARVLGRDMDPFDLLRQTHFPPERNFLKAHLTMFYRLPGEYIGQIVDHLANVADGRNAFTGQVSGLRHLGAGVAYTIASSDLEDIRARLRVEFMSWLGGQDMAKWQPHITIQNKVSKLSADDLYETLTTTFRAHSIGITGLDLWRYRNGPWRHEAAVMFGNPNMDFAVQAGANAELNRVVT